MTYRKKLIEVALPLEAINIASAREKSIRHGHPSTLHLWWARRPLAACRAVIFASLVDDPNDPEAPAEFVEACRNLPRGKNAAADDTPRQRLFDFIETLVQWESTTDEQVLETARRLIRLATNDNPPPLLDPFAGGGSIPLEAQRLGLEAHASDLNPVAVMINKALIEIPPRFANMPPVNPRDREKMGSGTRWKGAAGLAADVRYYGKWMRDRAWERIGHLYPDCNGETVIAWLWSRTVESPNPAVSAHVPLVRSFWLGRKKGQEVWLDPVINKSSQTYRFEIVRGKPVDRATIDAGTKAGHASFRCLLSNAPIDGSYIDEQAQIGKLKVYPLAIVTEGSKGRSYYPFGNQQAKTALVTAADYLKHHSDDRYLPTEQARGTFGSNAQGRTYGFHIFADYFSSRQLVALGTFTQLIHEVREQVQADALEAGMPPGKVRLGDNGYGAMAYAEAIAVYLSFVLSRAADRGSTICSWDSSPKMEALRNTFARQGIPMTWDYAEGNPFSDSSGSWRNNIQWIAKVIECLQPVVPGHADQKDARTIDSNGAVPIATDPPYYDNIEYGSLSDFFYVWMRRALGDIYPIIFSTMLVPKREEIVATAFRFDGDREAANRNFEIGLMQAFSRMRKIVSPDYPLTAYYAFKQAEVVAGDEVASTGWETMLAGLIDSGFMIVGTWPIRTELSNRMVASDRNALASSIVLVCRSLASDASVISRREFVDELRSELPIALRKMQSGNIAPVDLAQASIGPGMAIYSRYNKVLEPNGERLIVRTALQLINQELDAYLAEQEGHIDEDSRFAVAWFEQFGFREGPFGQADVLARAKNTSVDGLAHAGVLESGAGKVRLRRWAELDPAWDPRADRRLTVWEAVHHLVERLNVYGEEGAAMLLAKMPSELAAQARQLAYRLYSICERKGWAEHARDYNALVISWGASQEQARGFREQVQQGRLF
jgi:putative DNA methylase